MIMNKIMDGKLVRDIRLKELKNKIANLDCKLTLAVVSVGNDEASKIYIKQKEKLASKIGYNFLNVHFDSINENDLINKIKELNIDNSVTGIIVQLPLPNYLNKHNIFNSISPIKDVDGLTNDNFIKLIRNEEGLVPCTPKGIVSLLDYYKIDLKKNIVIVGRSELVGLPLFHLLLNRNATVTICHSKTDKLDNYTKNADILIVAVGKKYLIKKDMIKDNAVIVSVGINREDDKIYGDVDDSCFDKVLFMTPTPGGVGPMTVISLMENVYEAYQLSLEKKK